jgi:hypothetical protein
MPKTAAFAARALAALGVTLGAALAAAPAAHAQGLPDFTRMNLNQMNQNFNNGLNAQMMQRQQQIVGQNMNDPRVIAAYRQNPRGMSFPQFAYMYGATAGFTPQGMANYNNTSNQIAANDAAAFRSYQQAQAARAQAMQQQQQGFYNNQYQAGMQLRGCQYRQNNMGQVVWFCP